LSASLEMRETREGEREGVIDNELRKRERVRKDEIEKERVC